MMFMHDDKMIIMIITAVTNLTAKTRAPIHSGPKKSPMSGKKTSNSEVQNQNVFTQVKLLNTKKTRMSKKDFEETKNRFSMDGGLKCQSLNFQFTCIG